MKNWADHCSSDEESIEGIDHVAEQVQAQKLEDAAPESDVLAGDDGVAEDAPPPGPRIYDFPDKPPYTAFIGNLAYSLKESEDLKEAVAKCARDTLGQEINILGARISFDRTGKHRGFGYLELETLDELKLLMQLNDSEGTVAGRKIQLDTANGKQQSGRRNQQRRNNGDDVDGSNFRGGRFAARKDDGPPPQRPSLKLAPRTKKVEDGDKKEAGSANIFGGAKARDAQAWEERKKPSTGERRSSAPGGRGRGGREGREGRGNKGEVGGRDGGKDRRGAQERRKPEKKLISPEERAAAAKAAAEAAAPPTVTKPQAPTNKFALLMDSDSD